MVFPIYTTRFIALLIVLLIAFRCCAEKSVFERMDLTMLAYLAFAIAMWLFKDIQKISVGDFSLELRQLQQQVISTKVQVSDLSEKTQVAGAEARVASESAAFAKDAVTYGVISSESPDAFENSKKYQADSA